MSPLSETADDKHAPLVAPDREPPAPPAGEETYAEWCRGRGAHLVRCSHLTAPDAFALFMSSGAVAVVATTALLFAAAGNASVFPLVAYLSYVWVMLSLPTMGLWALCRFYVVPPIEWERSSVRWPLVVGWTHFGAMYAVNMVTLGVRLGDLWPPRDAAAESDDDGRAKLVLRVCSGLVAVIGPLAVCVAAALPRIAFRFRGVRARLGAE